MMELVLKLKIIAAEDSNKKIKKYMSLLLDILVLLTFFSDIF